MKYYLHDFSTLAKSFLILGVAIRIIMIVFIEPFAQTQWFIPFLSHTITNPSLDPWTNALVTLQHQNFPYGIVMLLSLLPATIPMSLFSGANPYFVGLSIKVTLLCFEMVCFILILGHWKESKKYGAIASALFWLSPLLLGATYWAGQLDIIPVTYLMATFYMLRKKEFAWSGFWLACAISTKMSMAFALPFIFIYFFRNSRMLPYAKRFFVPFSVSAFVLLITPLLSQGYLDMVLGTKELLRLLDMSFTINNAEIFITPIILSTVLYFAWSLPHLSYTLLTAFMALSTLLLTLTTQTPPGWFVWTMPFLLLHLVTSGVFQKILAVLFFCMVGVNQFLFWNLPTNVHFTNLPISHESMFYSFMLTINIMLGIVLINGILRNSFYRNEIFRFGRKPISFGIAGDSSAGKDTLALSLIHLFGKNSCLHISGDDYHSWDRKGALWKVMTHLNPRANDIKQFYSDINCALDKKTIVYRHYQHNNGCFSAPIKMRSKNFCIVSGLHTLLQKALCVRYDVKIFLEMDERLRAYLKCRRDKKERNHTLSSIIESMQKRASDSIKYIQPQQKNAEIVFYLSPSVNYDLTNIEAPIPPLLLTGKLRNAMYHEELVRYLIASCGLYVNIALGEGMDEITLEVEGNIAAEDVEFFVAKYLTEITELLDVKPCWESGVQGVMQIIILCQLMQNLKEKR